MKKNKKFKKTLQLLFIFEMFKGVKIQLRYFSLKYSNSKLKNTTRISQIYIPHIHKYIHQRRHYNMTTGLIRYWTPFTFKTAMTRRGINLRKFLCLGVRVVCNEVQLAHKGLFLDVIGPNIPHRNIVHQIILPPQACLIQTGCQHFQ